MVVSILLLCPADDVDHFVSFGGHVVADESVVVGECPFSFDSGLVLTVAW